MKDIKIPWIDEVIFLDNRITFKVEDYDPKTHVIFMEPSVGKRLVFAPSEEGFVDENYTVPVSHGTNGTYSIIVVEASTNNYIAEYKYEY